MVKIKLSYKKEEDKIRVIKQLSDGSNIKSISKPYKSGEFYRVYIEVK